MFLVIRWNAAIHEADPHLDRLIGEVKHGAFMRADRERWKKAVADARTEPM